MTLKVPEIYLASSSPQRYRLLQALKLEFTVITPNIDETPNASEPPLEYVMRLAVAKSNKAAQELSDQRSDTVIVGADTCVVLEDQKLGKPSCRENARLMLEKLAGQVHHVYSAVAVAHGNTTRCVNTVSSVEFEQLSDSDIESYLDSGESDNRAGSYAIQGKAGAFVKRLSGSLSSVVGLPVKETAQMLQLTGVSVPPYEIVAKSVRQDFAFEHDWPGEYYV